MRALLIASGVVVAFAAAAQSAMPRYEPSTRIRLSGEAGCLRDEVANGPMCVKKCQADFRLELESRPPACVGTKRDARYEPPKPEYTPPAKPPAGGAKGY